MGYSDAACVDQQCNQRPFGEHGDGCKLESGLVVSGRCTHDIDEQRATDATLPELQHARRTPLHGSYVHGITWPFLFPIAGAPAASQELSQAKLLRKQREQGDTRNDGRCCNTSTPEALP